MFAAERGEREAGDDRRSHEPAPRVVHPAGQDGPAVAVHALDVGRHLLEVPPAREDRELRRGVERVANRQGLRGGGEARQELLADPGLHEQP